MRPGKLRVYQRSSQSSSPSFLRPQHPSRMHRAGVVQEEPRHNMGSNCIRIDLRICWVLDRLASYKLPRALDSLLLYQQPSSTIEHCSLPTRKLSWGGGFITGNRRLINVLQVINRQWYVMGARSEVDVMNLSAPHIKY